MSCVSLHPRLEHRLSFCRPLFLCSNYTASPSNEWRNPDVVLIHCRACRDLYAISSFQYDPKVGSLKKMTSLNATCPRHITAESS